MAYSRRIVFQNLCRNILSYQVISDSHTTLELISATFKLKVLVHLFTYPICWSSAWDSFSIFELLWGDHSWWLTCTCSRCRFLHVVVFAADWRIGCLASVGKGRGEEKREENKYGVILCLKRDSLEHVTKAQLFNQQRLAKLCVALPPEQANQMIPSHPFNKYGSFIFYFKLILL